MPPVAPRNPLSFLRADHCVSIATANQVLGQPSPSGDSAVTLRVTVSRVWGGAAVFGPGAAVTRGLVAAFVWRMIDGTTTFATTPVVTNAQMALFPYRLVSPPAGLGPSGHAPYRHRAAAACLIPRGALWGLSPDQVAGMTALSSTRSSACRANRRLSVPWTGSEVGHGHGPNCVRS